MKQNKNFWLYGFLVLGLVLELAAMYVGLKTGSSLSGNCGNSRPSSTGVLLIALVGTSLAILSTVKALRAHRHRLEIIGCMIILLTLMMGIAAVFLATFRICF